MRTKSILEIHRESGDANIGQTLLRLARLAESVDQFATTEETRQSVREERGVVEEIDLGLAVLKRPVVDSIRPGIVHKEVER